MIRDNAKVELVRFVYLQEVHDLNNRLIVVKQPLPHMATYRHAIEFYDIALSAGKPLRQVMKMAFGCYSVDWMKKTFGRTYLPFQVIVGDRVRDFLRKELPPVVEPVNPTELADQYLKMLDGFDTETARQVIRSGFFADGDKKLEREMLEKLNRRVS